MADSSSLTVNGSTAGGDIYQTDLAIRCDKRPGLEITRFYAPELYTVSTFGQGWHLLVPFQISLDNKEAVNFNGLSLPKTAIVADSITGQTEKLYFDATRYEVAGYVPDKPDGTITVGLFPLTDGTFRMVDKLGNEFQFDIYGRLTDMLLLGGHHIGYEYGTVRCELDEVSGHPCRIEMIEPDRTAIQNITLPNKIRMVNEEQETLARLVLENNPDSLLVRFRAEQPWYQDSANLLLLSDGSFLFDSGQETQIRFDRSGNFLSAEATVIKSMSCGGQKVEFKYKFAGNQFAIGDAFVQFGPSEQNKISYQYQNDGRLSRVCNPMHRNIRLAYDDSSKRVLTYIVD
jgi:hypothetical protein